MEFSEFEALILPRPSDKFAKFHEVNLSSFMDEGYFTDRVREILASNPTIGSLKQDLRRMMDASPFGFDKAIDVLTRDLNRMREEERLNLESTSNFDVDSNR